MTLLLLVIAVVAAAVVVVAVVGVVGGGSASRGNAKQLKHPQGTSHSGLPCAFHVARIHLASLATSVKGISGRTEQSASEIPGIHPSTVRASGSKCMA